MARPNPRNRSQSNAATLVNTASDQAGGLPPKRLLLIIGVTVAVVIASGVWRGLHPAASYAPPASAAATFADEATCAWCHATEHIAWSGSHHHRAMQTADASSVLGSFTGYLFIRHGVASRFLQRNGGYWINAVGADGKSADFRVRYTFGIDPLQQYLLETSGGRLQAYTVAWDVKRRRWFDLYPNERIDFRDELHWTKPAQNWNYMCSECHSTDLHKSYDPASDAYKTTFAQIDVGCQACHGPSSRHLKWAASHKGRPANLAEMGFEVDLSARDSNVQIEGCARCHSRRATFWGDYRYGGRLMDTHLPALLDATLYHADGQIEGEVYEYGSFLQSRMYAKGVRCSDCHEPHTAALRGTGNALCATCHNADAPKARDSIDTSGLAHKDYDSSAHHFHKPGSPGSQCVACHMPERTYMIVDPRRDHSLRIPRPDLSVKLGTPNACNLCHTNRKAAWAAAAVANWYGPNRRQEAHYGEAIWAARTRQADAVSRLSTLARDASQPDIARATAVRLLRDFPGPAANDVFRDALLHSDPLIRRAALEGLDALAPAQRLPLAAPLLRDRVRAVRIEAARLLAPVPADQLDAATRSALEDGLTEYLASQSENAERPEAHANLGGLYASQGRADLALVEYREAIERDAAFVPAYVNLADLQRTAGREKDAEQTLRAGLRVAPKDASLHHALGLSLIRQRRSQEALAELALSAKQTPPDPRYLYVYGVALHDLGKPREGVSVLERALARFPGDRDLLTALAGYAQEKGDVQAAARYAARIRQLDGGEGR